MATMIDPRRLIESTETRIAGRELTVSLYSTPNRHTGRRIVATQDAETVFDTDDCYDWANAVSKLSEWITNEEQKMCVHCSRPSTRNLLGAQDDETGGPICDECVRKALGRDMPTATVTPTAPPEPVFGDKAPSECPF